MQWHHRWLGVWLCASIFFSNACAAVIDRKSGPRIVGHIDRSDETQLFVTTQDDKRYTIERSDIVAIDHPGKPAMWLGGGGFLAGAGLTALGFYAASAAENCTHNCPSGFIGLVGFMGIMNWKKSTNPSPAPCPTTPRPASTIPSPIDPCVAWVIRPRLPQT